MLSGKSNVLPFRLVVNKTVVVWVLHYYKTPVLTAACVVSVTPFWHAWGSHKLRENKLGLGGRGLTTIRSFQKRECCRKWF